MRNYHVNDNTQSLHFRNVMLRNTFKQGVSVRIDNKINLVNRANLKLGSTLCNYYNFKVQLGMHIMK